MEWSSDEKELQKQVIETFQRLGFEWPETSEQLDEFEEAFKDYPYKLKGHRIDAQKIINEATVKSSDEGSERN